MLKERWTSSTEETLLVLGGKPCSTLPNTLMLTFPEWETHQFIPVKLVFSDIVALKKRQTEAKKKKKAS